MDTYRKIGSLAATALVLGLGAGQASAAYTANFDTTGSAADFASIGGFANGATTVNGTNNATSPTAAEVTSGDDALRISGSATANTSGGGPQFRSIFAPSLVEGAELALPTGSDFARFSVTIEGRQPGSDPATEQPFLAFGLADFNAATNTANYGDKFIIQVNSDLNSVNLGRSLDGANPNSTAAQEENFEQSPNVAFPVTIELQVTDTLYRVLVNGVAQTDAAGTDTNGYIAHGLTLTDFDGDTLIPFVGAIRGTVLEAGDSVSADFDNLDASVVPEPGALGLAGLASLGLLARRRRSL